MPSAGQRRCPRPLWDLLAPILRDARDGRRHVWHDPLGVLDASKARRAEAFLLGHGADRRAVRREIPSAQRAVAAYAALHVDTVVRVAEGVKTLGDLLALRGEALVRLARRVDVLLALLHARGSLWGAPWAALGRRLGDGVEGLGPPRERLFRLGDSLVGRSLCDGHGRCNGLAQRGLPMEEVRRRIRPEGLCP